MVIFGIVFCFCRGETWLVRIVPASVVVFKKHAGILYYSRAETRPLSVYASESNIVIGNLLVAVLNTFRSLEHELATERPFKRPFSE